MIKSRRKFTSEFKSKVAIEALQEQDTIESICKKYDLHPNQVNLWKRELKAKSALAFDSSGRSDDKKDQLALIDELYKQIGQLKVAYEFLKKKLS